MRFSCDKCEKTYIRKEHLTRHKNNHSETVFFSCPECEHVSRRKDLLLRHQRTHTQERTYICLKCKKIFSRKDGLQKHQKVHTKLKSFSCLECNKGFLGEVSLKRHQRTHGSVVSFIPNVALRAIHKKEQRGRSTNQILQRRFSCTDCDKSFALQITFQRHQAVHTKMYLKILSKVMHKEETSYVTAGNSSDKRQELFSCTQCDKSFSVLKGLVVHQRVHTQCFTCSECGKSYSLKYHLVKHQRIHSSHCQSKDSTLQRDKNWTAAAHEEYDNENKDHSQRGSNVSSISTLLSCFNGKKQAENNQIKHPKRRVLETDTVCSKKVILKAATFVFRSSFS